MMTPDPAAFPGATGATGATGAWQPARRARRPAASIGELPEGDAALLGFVVEMYGVQLDQLAALLADWGEPAGSAAGRAQEVAARWRAAGYADSDRLTLGEPWVWATRKGLNACGMKTTLVKPGPSTLRHTHAVTEARLAVQRTSSYRRSRAWWRSERSILAGEFPARVGHAPDAEVHYPAGSGMPWAGEIWAVEVELSRKSVARVAAIMQATLDRTSDFGGPAAHAVPGHARRYARVVYLASATTVLTVLHARAELSPGQSERIEVYDLPSSSLRLHTPKRGWEP
jgi:hypothetical protein